VPETVTRSQRSRRRWRASAARGSTAARSPKRCFALIPKWEYNSVTGQYDRQFNTDYAAAARRMNPIRLRLIPSLRVSQNYRSLSKEQAVVTNDLLKQGIAALKAGQKAEARNLLLQVVKQNKRNEVAWLWLSGAVNTDKERRICLENVLAINPDNEAAKRGLASLATKESIEPVGATPSPATPVKKRGNNSQIKLLIALSASILLAIVGIVVVLSLTRVLFPITDVVEPSDPKRVAQRFFEGGAQPDDLAPDGRYESASLKGYGNDPMAWLAGELRGSSIDPFNDMWAVRSDARTDYALEIHNIIVRDSLRPNSKEVTIIYTERYNQIQPPWMSKPLGGVTSEDMKPVPPEQWYLTGKYIVRDQVAFFIVEQLDDRWVVWCAEIEPSSDFLPDICTY